MIPPTASSGKQLVLGQSSRHTLQVQFGGEKGDLLPIVPTWRRIPHLGKESSTNLARCIGGVELAHF